MWLGFERKKKVLFCIITKHFDIGLQHSTNFCFVVEKTTFVLSPKSQFSKKRKHNFDKVLKID